MYTMLKGAELWPLTVAQKEKLEAAHHKFQRRIMEISWKDKVSNERVRAQTQLEKINLIIKERRLRWPRHVLRMDDNRLPRLEYKRYKKKAWKTKKELDRHHTTRFEKHRHDLESSATTCCQQRTGAYLEIWIGRGVKGFGLVPSPPLGSSPLLLSSLPLPSPCRPLSSP